MSKKLALMTGGNKGGAALTVEDVFSTYLYTGTGAALDIVNGIDLSTEGGMVWFKSRSHALNNALFDTERGLNYRLTSDNTTSGALASRMTKSFNTNGFTLDLDDSNGDINTSGREMTSWTFRNAPNFFQAISYTGNGVAGREIAHDLGCDVGCMIVKSTSDTTNWTTYHKSLGGVYNLNLNLTSAQDTGVWAWNDTDATSTEFTLGTGGSVNTIGREYIAYLFAHDPSDEGMIQCGGFTTDGSGNYDGSDDLGWEPQWMLIKDITLGGNWMLVDSMRGCVVGGIDSILYPNLSSDEGNTVDILDFMPRGFTTLAGVLPVNRTYIYIAIRRPMKTPDSSSEVFAIDQGDASGAPEFDAGFPVDMALFRHVGAQGFRLASRLTQGQKLETDNTGAESANTGFVFDYQEGWQDATRDTTYYSWMFKRATGFHDIVTYTGTGVAHAESHNLGVVPEMIWVKRRSVAGAWEVYHSGYGATKYLQLNETDALVSSSSIWNNTEPTSNQFTIGTASPVNASSSDFMALLFATLAGISKVGSYTGNGTSQTIDCSFSAGTKFLIIKRTDSTGDWFMFDSTRGIVAGNDPHLSLNTTAAEVTTDDSIDPDSSGFIVNQVAATNINVSSAEYIFYAVSE